MICMEEYGFRDVGEVCDDWFRPATCVPDGQERGSEEWGLALDAGSGLFAAAGEPYLLWSATSFVDSSVVVDDAEEGYSLRLGAPIPLLFERF